MIELLLKLLDKLKELAELREKRYEKIFEKLIEPTFNELQTVANSSSPCPARGRLVLQTFQQRRHAGIQFSCNRLQCEHSWLGFSVFDGGDMLA